MTSEIIDSTRSARAENFSKNGEKEKKAKND